MISVLSWATTAVNVLGLAISLCLSFYLVTHTPRSRLSWLAALMLWATTGFFLHNALALNAPGSSVLPLLRPAVILALPLGFHLTLLLPPADSPWFYQPALRLPAPLRHTLGSLALPISRLVVPLAYTLGLALAVGGVFPLGPSSGDATALAVYLSARSPRLLYPLAIAYLVPLAVLTLVHLWLGRRQAASQRQRRRYTLRLAVFGRSLAGLGSRSMVDSDLKRFRKLGFAQGGRHALSQMHPRGLSALRHLHQVRL